MLRRIHLYTTPYYILYKGEIEKTNTRKPNKRHYNYIR